MQKEPHIPVTHPPDIAGPDEVLATFTQLLRSEKPSEQLKAAEQLAKYHSLFTAKAEDEPDTSAIVAEIEAALQQIRAESAAGGGPEPP